MAVVSDHTACFISTVIVLISQCFNIGRVSSQIFGSLSNAVGINATLNQVDERGQDDFFGEIERGRIQ